MLICIKRAVVRAFRVGVTTLVVLVVRLVHKSLCLSSLLGCSINYHSKLLTFGVICLQSDCTSEF